MNAWPAMQVSLLDGWVLRIASGYTKRANSVNPTYPSSEGDLARKVETCEAIYARQQLPCIFRLTSFGAPAGLDDLLAERGYRRFDHSLVLCRELGNDSPPVQSDPRLSSRPVEPWLNEYVRLSRSPLSRRDAHLAILERIPGNAIFGVLAPVDEGNPVAAGLAVTEGEYVGLFDIVTDPDHRNRGHGAALVTALLASAQASGAKSAYLQVVAENAAAIALYRKLGFTEAYHYWYRIPPDQ